MGFRDCRWILGWSWSDFWFTLLSKCQIQAIFGPISISSRFQVNLSSITNKFCIWCFLQNYQKRILLDLRSFQQSRKSRVEIGNRPTRKEAIMWHFEPQIRDNKPFSSTIVQKVTHPIEDIHSWQSCWMSSWPKSKRSYSWTMWSLREGQKRFMNGQEWIKRLK